MNEVKLRLNEKGHGAFYIIDSTKQMGEMVIGISGENLTVYHTEVAAEAEGNGYAKKMLDTMVNHARLNKLKLIPLCPYVHAQLKRHPNDYLDVWQNNKEV